MYVNRGELFDNAWLSYSSRAAATQTDLTTVMSAFEENFTTSKGYLILVGTVESNTSVSDKAGLAVPEDEEEDLPVSFIGEFGAKLHYLRFTNCGSSENELTHMVGKGAIIAVNEIKELNGHKTRQGKTKRAFQHQQLSNCTTCTCV